MIPIRLKDTSIIDRHFLAIKEFFNRSGMKFKYTDINKWISEVTSNNYDLEKVIKAKPTEFSQIIQAVQANIKKSYNDDSHKNTIGSNYSLAHYFTYIYSKFSNSGDEQFNKIGYGALDLVNSLEIDVCPYCNRNFITNTILSGKDGTKQIRRTAQLDHYYPDSEYPFLALSFYNLIPVCSSCNKIKLAEEFEVNPYTVENSDENIVFDYDFNETIKDVKITTKHISKEFKKNWEVLGLEELYQAHNSYLSDLLFRMEIYNDLYLKDLSKYLSDWSEQIISSDSAITDEDVRRILIGNYYLEEDLGKHPLSKLTKDIVSGINSLK